MTAPVRCKYAYDIETRCRDVDLVNDDDFYLPKLNYMKISSHAASSLRQDKYCAMNIVAK